MEVAVAEPFFELVNFEKHLLRLEVLLLLDNSCGIGTSYSYACERD